MIDIARNIKEVRKRIEDAKARCGREGEQVTLIAVSKQVEAPRILEAIEAGIDTFGENYAQEFRDKHKVVEKGTAKNVKWHFIGRLQRNKVKYIVGSVDCIHSVDSLSVAKEISKRSEALGLITKILVEVNAGESEKGGVVKSNVESFLKDLNEWPGLSVEGLMTMPPYFDEPEKARPHFAELRSLRDELKTSFTGIEELSMGMSGDFEVAIEEGATMIRVGSAIFGPRG